MKELEDENPRLNKMYAEECLKLEIVAEALTKIRRNCLQKIARLPTG